MIKAKVMVETAKKTYRKGEVIAEELSEANIAFLKKHNFIEMEEDAASVESEDFESETGGLHEGDMDCIDKPALEKMTKKELVAYAAGLGMQLDEKSMKDEMIDAILNHTEENEGVSGWDLKNNC